LANFLTLLFNGISEGAIIFLMASGLSIILGLLRVVNFAHGVLFIWGAYVFRMVVDVTGSWGLGIAAAAATGFIMGAVFERVFISRTYGNVTGQILITLGLQIVFTELIRVAWGPTALPVERPGFLQGLWNVNGVIIVHYRLFLIIVGIVVAVVGQFILRRTRVGMTIRAGVQNSEMVGALGINIQRYFTMVFAVGGALAGLGGALFIPINGMVSSEMGNATQLLAFIVVIIGGMGNFAGSAVGSLFLGVMIALIGWTVPAISLVAPVLLMALVLIFRPAGLFRLVVRK